MNKQSKPPAPPSIEFLGVKILRGFKPGDLIFLEVDKPLRVEAMQHIHAELKRMLPDVRVVVLQHGLKVAGREETGPWMDLVLQWRGLLEGVAVDSPAYQAAQQMDEVLADLRAGGSS